MSTATVDGADVSDTTDGTDLVNAALLGTDRRVPAVPAGADPAAWLLAEAARRRAVRVVAGPVATVHVSEAGPVSVLSLPPREARELLDELLTHPGDATAITAWLQEAVDAGHGLAPEHWAPVLDRARRATGLDRRLLGAALGEAGLWFARHNPSWAAVVRVIEEGRP